MSDGYVYSIVMSFDVMEPVPPPMFDPADLREGDIFLVKGFTRPLFVLYPKAPAIHGSIELVWRLDESGDYRFIFPKREVQ